MQQNYAELQDSWLSNQYDNKQEPYFTIAKDY